VKKKGQKTVYYPLTPTLSLRERELKTPNSELII
jgi:hypothetical protein